MICKALRASKRAAAYDALTAEYAASGLPVPASAKRKARKKAIDEREQLGKGLPQNVAEEAQQHSLHLLTKDCWALATNVSLQDATIECGF